MRNTNLQETLKSYELKPIDRISKDNLMEATSENKITPATIYSNKFVQGKRGQNRLPEHSRNRNTHSLTVIAHPSKRNSELDCSPAASSELYSDQEKSEEHKKTFD